MDFFKYLSQNFAYVITVLLVISVIIIACVLKVYLMKLNFNKKRKKACPTNNQNKDSEGYISETKNKDKS